MRNKQGGCVRVRDRKRERERFRKATEYSKALHQKKTLLFQRKPQHYLPSHVLFKTVPCFHLDFPN